ncbi:MAG: aminopeptidase P family protein, partial [Marinovum sp.]|nr:aminopeptidase P family protein [Marinovum sp.]
MFDTRMTALRHRLDKNCIDVALITDDDNIYYLTGYYDYLHMEFGRPTILVVHRDGPSVLITPTIDFNTAKAAARVDRIAPWNDGMGAEWRAELPALINAAQRVAIEPDHIPSVVRRYICDLIAPDRLTNVTPVLNQMRMIKSTEELQLARHAGQVANAMMTAGRAAISEGVPEFEVAIATSQAGTRKAAMLLEAHYDDSDMSPNTHFLQIMASGDTITKTHHRATTRIMRRGEPVFLCFCGMTNFHRFKLGFDRTFWIGEIADTSQADV